MTTTVTEKPRHRIHRTRLQVGTEHIFRHASNESQVCIRSSGKVPERRARRRPVLVEGLEFPVDATLLMLIVGISALWSLTQDPITDYGLMAKSRNQLPKIFFIATELASSRRFHAASRGFVIRETPDRGGGRVATDVCEGDRRDHGFQVLPTAYPEGLRRFDHNAPELRRSYPTVRKLEFARWSFVYGDTAIPKRGLAKIPRQTAATEEGREDLP